MNPADPRIPPALQAALQRVVRTAGDVARRTTDSLGLSAMSAGSVRERDAFLAAQFELNRHRTDFVRRFGEVLEERVAHDVAPRGAGPRTTTTDWHNLSLVQDDEVEEMVTADRLGQMITQECEWELREIAAFMGTVLRTGRAALEQNPLRPELIGKAMFRALESVSSERGTRALLMREIGLAMGKAMRQCYVDIVAELQGRGIQPVGLTVKGVDGPGYDLPHETLRRNSAYDTLPPPPEETDPPPYLRAGYGYGAAGHSGYPGSAGSHHDVGMPGGSTRGVAFAPSRPGDLRQLPSGGFRHSRPSDLGGPPVDPYMADLIRRLAVLTAAGVQGSALGAVHGGRGGHVGHGIPGSSTGGAYPEAFHDTPSSGRWPALGPGMGYAPVRDAASPGATANATNAAGAPRGLVAPNLIHAYRDELREAATGTLDLLVIDVVGSLFDHILSDAKVPPQMARQIARLQLPVLRVALADASFFSSRSHPVRRFVNRIASLACAHDSLSEGRGSELLGRVRDLVQEIVDGDFDRLDVYEAQLGALETFVHEQIREDLRRRGSPTPLLHQKEHEVRLQQRYKQTLMAGLAPLSMPEFVREFLAETWSRVITLAAERGGGPNAEAARRFRGAGRELVMSVQPKGSPSHRKQFLVKLPQLMKDLAEGMVLIGWEDALKKRFMGLLMPAQTESLRGQPLSELAYNLMASEIDTILARSMPTLDDLPPGELPKVAELPLDDRFSSDEAQRVGLVPEAAVDWRQPVAAAASADDEITQPGDIGLPLEGLPPADAPEPLRGPDLMAHLQIGFAYRMQVRDEWHKVQLSHVSPGRAFFVFTRGQRNEETISMTARMVARLCETERLQAFENAYLIERATARARRQLGGIRV